VFTPALIAAMRQAPEQQTTSTIHQTLLSAQSGYASLVIPLPDRPSKQRFHKLFIFPSLHSNKASITCMHLQPIKGMQCWNSTDRLNPQFNAV
jgi:hypothetical protein